MPAGPNSWTAVSIRVVSQSTHNMKEDIRMTPGMSSRRAARTRMRRRKMSVKLEVTMPKGKSLGSVSLRISNNGEGAAHQGMPTLSWSCTTMNQANMPRTVDDAASMIKIHRFNCTSGHRNLRLVDSLYMISSVAILSTRCHEPLQARPS